MTSYPSSKSYFLSHCRRTEIVLVFIVANQYTKFDAYKYGLLKTKYCLKKPLWLLMKYLIEKQEYTSEAALNMIYQVYQGAMTQIMKRIQMMKIRVVTSDFTLSLLVVRQWNQRLRQILLHHKQ